MKTEPRDNVPNTSADLTSFSGNGGFIFANADKLIFPLSLVHRRAETKTQCAQIFTHETPQPRTQFTRCIEPPPPHTVVGFDLCSGLHRNYDFVPRSLFAKLRSEGGTHTHTRTHIT